MDYLTGLLPLFKVLCAFAAMLAGIRLRLGLPLSILAGSVLLAALFSLSPMTWFTTAALALADPQTLCLAGIVACIMILSDLLEKTGQNDRLMRAVSPCIKNPALRITFFPALIGLLPMPGGAHFSAPMVKSVGDPLAVPPTDQALINYWFRHLWEPCWPLYPGLILAASLSGASIAAIMAATWPAALLCTLIGWHFFLRPNLKNAPTLALENGRTSPLALFILGLPLLTAILGAIGAEALFAAMHTDLPFEIGIMAALAAASLVCALQNRVAPRDILRELTNRHTLHMLAVIAAIFIFKDILGATGVAAQLAASAGKEAVLVTAAAVVPFFVGLVSGITMAYVGAAFPLLMAVIPATAAGPDLAWITLAILCGYTGVLISPLHICFIFSCSYYHVDLAKAWRRLVAPCALFLAVSLAYVALL
jgi:integral membrane protein (TIGR00529 family)